MSDLFLSTEFNNYYCHESSSSHIRIPKDTKTVLLGNAIEYVGSYFDFSSDLSAGGTLELLRL